MFEQIISSVYKTIIIRLNKTNVNNMLLNFDIILKSIQNKFHIIDCIFMYKNDLILSSVRVMRYSTYKNL